MPQQYAIDSLVARPPPWEKRIANTHHTFETSEAEYYSTREPPRRSLIECSDAVKYSTTVRVASDD